MKAKEIREEARKAAETKRAEDLENFELESYKKELKAEERQRRKIRFQKQAL